MNEYKKPLQDVAAPGPLPSPEFKPGSPRSTLRCPSYTGPYGQARIQRGAVSPYSATVFIEYPSINRLQFRSHFYPTAHGWNLNPAPDAAKRGRSDHRICTCLSVAIVTPITRLIRAYWQYHGSIEIRPFTIRSALSINSATTDGHVYEGCGLQPGQLEQWKAGRNQPWNQGSVFRKYL